MVCFWTWIWFVRRCFLFGKLPLVGKAALFLCSTMFDLDFGDMYYKYRLYRKAYNIEVDPFWRKQQQLLYSTSYFVPWPRSKINNTKCDWDYFIHSLKSTMIIVDVFVKGRWSQSALTVFCIGRQDRVWLFPSSYLLISLLFLLVEHRLYFLLW